MEEPRIPAYERERQYAPQQLQVLDMESNRIKSDFLSMMSHALRTPLTVVLGYLPPLKDPKRLPSPEDIRSLAEDMQVAGNHPAAVD